ncbi:IS200/IS605 family transposase [Okeania sp. SIO2C9]|uniref:IS200/IS605 family transposase n=1 Tax=Okeania sp. SIO2C9 TaxID=2607791 RepID=UPI0035C8846D
MLWEVTTEKAWLIKGLEIAPDHVHVLVEHGCDVAIQIVKALKGRSSRLLGQEFPELCKLSSLWTHSYFYDTTGKVSTAVLIRAGLILCGQRILS